MTPVPRRPAVHLGPLVVLALFALTGCSSADDAPKPPAKAATAPATAAVSTEVAELATGYTRLTRMTAEPVYVDPGLAMLCRGADRAEVERARVASGPHAHAAVTIYMNGPAAGAFRGSAGTYPVGSVIVKEKRPLAYWVAEPGGQQQRPHDGVGGMIKRAAGYDPVHGDWEYFYFEDPARIETGRIRSCAQCHAAAAGRDYVFGGWADRR